MPAPTFTHKLLGWKRTRSGQLVANTADSTNKQSKELAATILDQMGLQRTLTSGLPSDPGPLMEGLVKEDLALALPHLEPNRRWDVDRKESITEFAQYSHLSRVDELVVDIPELRITLGRDYLIKPDVIVGIDNHSPLDTDFPFLHAAVSCKWTIRSDRVQNIRHEFRQMIRHRRGRQPHLVTVTAEPLPSRITAIARGTGEVDAIYHIAFDELAQAVDSVGNANQQEHWAECVDQRRVLPYEALPKTLARW